MHRNLPWRQSHDPYAIWVSEVMLQQTTAAFAAARFPKWMDRFPTIESLALANEREVLSEWEGLGYYNRARNLHLAAKQVMAEFAGKLPTDYKTLRSLPGIGEYTANALLAIAFDKPAPAIDVNIQRILQRFVAFREAASTKTIDDRDFLTKALEISSPRLMIEALMELGQTVCTVRSPVCDVCPLNSICASAGVDTSATKPMAKIINRRENLALVADWNGSILLATGQTRLFRGMKLLPTLDQIDGWEETSRRWCSEIGLEVNNLSRLRSVNHCFTTNAIKLWPITINIANISGVVPDGYDWIGAEELDRCPMPSAHRRIIGMSGIKAQSQVVCLNLCKKA